MVIERWGRFNRVCRSGLNVLIPWMERPRTIDVRYFEADPAGVKRVTSGSTARIDLREQVLNFPSQPVITKDNVTIDIDAVLYYRIADPQKAAYAIQNLPFALETLTRTTLRNIVGDIELDQTLASRDMINKRMREVIEEASIGWGVDVTRVELQAIEPPRDIQQSMELQMRAERERRAAVTNAEASKRAAILEAEGVQQSQVQPRARRSGSGRAAREGPRRSAPGDGRRGSPGAAAHRGRAPRAAMRRCICSASNTSRRCRSSRRARARRSSSPLKPRASWARSVRCAAYSIAPPRRPTPRAACARRRPEAALATRRRALPSAAVRRVRLRPSKPEGR